MTTYITRNWLEFLHIAEPEHLRTGFLVERKDGRLIVRIQNG